MLSLANQFVARATRLFFAAAGEPALWTVSANGRVVGSLVCQNGSWRLSWFNGADRRLTSYAGPLGGDVEVLAESLSARLGAPVRLESQPVKNPAVEISQTRTDSAAPAPLWRCGCPHG